MNGCYESQPNGRQLVTRMRDLATSATRRLGCAAIEAMERRTFCFLRWHSTQAER